MREAASQRLLGHQLRPLRLQAGSMVPGRGRKKRPTLELNPPADAVVWRIFDMALQGKSIPRHHQGPQRRGRSQPPRGSGGSRAPSTPYSATRRTPEPWSGEPKPRTERRPVRVEKAFPALVSKRKFRQARRRLLALPRPQEASIPAAASSPYLLSGLVRCETCGRAMTAAEAQSGKYTYYVCQSLVKRGSGNL